MHEPESPLELALCGSSSPGGQSESVAGPESIDTLQQSWIEATCKDMREANERTLKEVAVMRAHQDSGGMQPRLVVSNAVVVKAPDSDAGLKECARAVGETGPRIHPHAHTLSRLVLLLL